MFKFLITSGFFLLTSTTLIAAPNTTTAPKNQILYQQSYQLGPITGEDQETLDGLSLTDDHGNKIEIVARYIEKSEHSVWVSSMLTLTIDGTFDRQLNQTIKTAEIEIKTPMVSDDVKFDKISSEVIADIKGYKIFKISLDKNFAAKLLKLKRVKTGLFGLQTEVYLDLNSTTYQVDLKFRTTDEESSFAGQMEFVDADSLHTVQPTSSTTCRSDGTRCYTQTYPGGYFRSHETSLTLLDNGDNLYQIKLVKID